MKNKKIMKCYLSAAGIKGAIQKKIICNTYESIRFVETIAEAEFFLLPIGIEEISARQKSELEMAEKLGMKKRVFKEEVFSVMEDVEDPLKLEQEEFRKQQEQLNSTQEELDDYELSIFK